MFNDPIQQEPEKANVYPFAVRLKKKDEHRNEAKQRVRSSVLPEHRGYFAARGAWGPCAHVHQSLAALLLLEFSCVFHDMLSRFGTILSFVLNDAAWTMEPANRLYGICNAALDARV